MVKYLQQPCTENHHLLKDLVCYQAVYPSKQHITSIGYEVQQKGKMSEEILSKDHFVLT